MLGLRNISSNQLKVLSILSHGDQYGYEISKSLEEHGAKVSLGSMYGLLESLEKKGFIEGYEGEATESRKGRRKRYYKITGAGESALFEEQQIFSGLWQMKLI